MYEAQQASEPQMTASEYEARKAKLEAKLAHFQRELADLEAAYAQQQGRVVEVPRKSREQVMAEMDELFPPR
jgi:uncharacterized coiled-coil protein SlyX